jgi:hypothetical protein
VVKTIQAQMRDATSPLGYSIVPVHAWTHTMADVVA